jgi:hypothetical protein
MPLFDIVLSKMITDGSLRRFSQAYGKETDRLKQLGFYVGLSDQGEIQANPKQITREIAEDHVGFVFDVLKALRTRLPNRDRGDAPSVS